MSPADQQSAQRVLPTRSERNRLPSQPGLSESAAAGSSSPRRSQPAFNDIADSVGIRFEFHTDFTEDRYYLPEIMGGGVGAIDFDRDGRMDLFFPNGSVLIPDPTNPVPLPGDMLFHQGASGIFRNDAVVAGVGSPGYGQGCAIADFDADGFPDIYLTEYGRNHLYQNNGDGTFVEVDSSVVGGSQLWSTSCAWVDVNHDLLPDLYVVNYLSVRKDNIRTCDYSGIVGYCGPGEYDALQDEVFVNQGDGTFSDETADRGFISEDGKGLAICVLDFNHDLKPEIYVANDMTENFMFSTTVPGASDAKSSPQWQNLAGISGCAVSESGMNEASMGVACADFDFDQLPDIYLTHFYHQKNTLYHNQGNLTFLDDSRRFRVTVTSNDFLGFGVVPFDYDSDGAMDLFVANGHVLGPKYSPSRMRPQLLENVEGKWLDDVSSSAGEYFREYWLGRGAAGIDFDNDGDRDLAVSHLAAPVVLLQNDTPPTYSRVYGFQLEDTFRNAPVGGRIEVQVGDWRRSFPVSSGGSYLSSPDPRLLIPVPDDAESAVVFRVYWTSGKVDEYSDLEPGCYWLIREGRMPVVWAEFNGKLGKDAP
ncbi:MAG: CRTAC1 family protein [Planctomycetaceae bacterium]|nr:CRTAC1 family protein [Planctomycetaceae bacterium]